MTFVLATNNQGKAREIKPLFDAAGLKLISLADLGLSFEAREDGKTFADNATQKATETATFLVNKSMSEYAVLADDSGLVIDALDGQPGVDSALFMGRDTPYEVKNQSLLDMLVNTPCHMRTARFICTLACVFPGGSSGSMLMAEGVIEGSIAHNASGIGGFGYDPIFHYPPFGKTLAELTCEEKSQVSHRGQAIQKMIGLIIDADFNNK